MRALGPAGAVWLAMLAPALAEPPAWFVLDPPTSRAAHLDLKLPQTETTTIVVWAKQWLSKPLALAEIKADTTKHWDASRPMFDASPRLSPTYCSSAYSTIGGQPATGKDMIGSLGAGGC